MATTRKTPAKAAPAKASAAPKAAGLDQNTILLAALAVAGDGQVEVPFSAYGEVLARQDDLKGILVSNIPGVGVQVTVEWKQDEDDATDDVEAIQEATKSAYTPASPSFGGSLGYRDELANTGA